MSSPLRAELGSDDEQYGVRARDPKYAENVQENNSPGFMDNPKRNPIFPNKRLYVHKTLPDCLMHGIAL